MEKYGLNELREKFLAFFETKGHLRLPSFSLIPQNDPSLLLINAGMSPMKTWFTGEQEPPRKRVTTCQKCIRTPDIENIGKTARHGTYFEMMGNFSFGDYFKKDAINWAWEFLTSPQWVGLDPDKLYPSVYIEDNEAVKIWHDDIGIPEERIFRLGKEDNFWEHGSGPCGPCSEIYYDRGPEFGCGKPECTVGCECDRYIEVWNLVFTQFSNDGKNNYSELAQKNIDTGMGLERLAVVCQGVGSLFDVDTVMKITNKVSEITGALYHQTPERDVSLRIITDHIRSSTFMICDGVLPSNEGRGYVLRRLLRRAARHGRLLGVTKPFLYDVCATVVSENANAYPELAQRQDYITRVIKTEEENFARTIDSGIKIFNDYMEEFKAGGAKAFSAEAAFKLHDTYGFPIDLTEEMAGEQGLFVDRKAFAECLKEQKERARAARGDMSEAWQGVDLNLDNTPTGFVGYDTMEDKAKLLAIVIDNELSSSISAGAKGIIVLDKTPFYAEKGGQVADYGVIKLGESEFTVTDVQYNKGEKILHHGVMTKGSLSVDDEVFTCVDTARRKAIMRAHSATHLLQKALRTVVGDHVQQAGSLVEPDRLRFDFTHYSAISEEDLEKIEKMVNEAILDDYPVNIKEMPIDEAKKLGAMALFSEKYGDTVRVVSMGDYSVELCGGIHLANTAKVGPFRILSEFSVASGVRRIEAITGELVMEEMRRGSHIIRHISESMKTNPGELEEKFEQMMTEFKNSRKLVEKLQAQQLKVEAERVLFGAKTVKGLRIITGVLPEMTGDDLRQMGDMLRDRDENVVAVLASSNGGKIAVASACGDIAIKKGIRAGDLVKHVTSITGGSGGGKPERAMGGAKDELKLDDALASVDNYVDEKVKD